jgi:phosphomannomutase/phosphoglucomutase
MQVNPHIFRGYDVRGLVNKDLTPEIVLHFGKAHGTYLIRNGHKKAIVARDHRESSPLYAQKFIEGFISTGLDVIDIGMEMVGTFYWSQHYLKVPGGVMITASHNPPEFNGFKLASGYSETLVSDSIQELRQMIEKEDYEVADKPGTVTKQSVREAYYEDLLKRLVIKRKLKVVIDPSNTSAGEVLPPLLKKAGCEVIEYNTKVDPSFPLGVADPTEMHIMERVGQEVRDNKADIGFTYDADGDRVGITDENGRPIWNDVLLALFAKDVLVDHPGSTIMFNLLCSKVVPETIKQSGGTPFMWRTGHSFLKKKNQEVKAAFIGELSGHFFFSKDFYNHDDGAYSTLRILQALSRTDKSLSELVSSLPLYESSPQIHVYCEDSKKIELTERLAKQLRKDFPQAEVVDDERAGDGLRLEEENSMFVIRYSQNGPYIVIKFEARDEEGYEKLRKYIQTTLKTYPELDWSTDNKINVNIKELDR